jgi:hypothetical protein
VKRVQGTPLRTLLFAIFTDCTISWHRAATAPLLPLLPPTTLPNTVVAVAVLLLPVVAVAVAHVAVIHLMVHVVLSTLVRDALRVPAHTSTLVALAARVHTVALSAPVSNLSSEKIVSLYPLAPLNEGVSRSQPQSKQTLHPF